MTDVKKPDVSNSVAEPGPSLIEDDDHEEKKTTADDDDTTVNLDQDGQTMYDWVQHLTYDEMYVVYN